MRTNASAGTTASRMAVRLRVAAGAGTGQRPGIQVTLQEVRTADSARIEDQQVSEGTGGGRCTSPRRDKSRQSEECWQPQPYFSGNPSLPLGGFSPAFSQHLSFPPCCPLLTCRGTTTTASLSFFFQG